MACSAKMPARSRSPRCSQVDDLPWTFLATRCRRPPPAARLPGRFPVQPKCKAPGGQHTYFLAARARALRSTATTPRGLTPPAPIPRMRRPHGARARSGARRAAPATRAGARCCASAPSCCSHRPARGPATGAASTQISTRSRRLTRRAASTRGATIGTAAAARRAARASPRSSRRRLRSRRSTTRGRIKSWGIPHPEESTPITGAPSGTGFTALFSTVWAFATLDEEGRIHAWGDSTYGGSGACGAQAGTPTQGRSRPAGR